MLATYADAEEWAPSCDTLGHRLKANGDTEAASLCYLCSGNMEEVVKIWATTISSGPAGTKQLQEIIERAVILTQASTHARSPSSACSALAVRYAGLLVEEGQIEGAMDFLLMLPSDESSGLAVLKDRIYQSSSGLANYPVPPFPFVLEEVNQSTYAAQQPSGNAASAYRHQQPSQPAANPYASQYVQPQQPAPSQYIPNQPKMYQPAAPAAPPSAFTPPTAMSSMPAPPQPQVNRFTPKAPAAPPVQHFQPAAPVTQTFTPAVQAPAQPQFAAAAPSQPSFAPTVPPMQPAPAPMSAVNRAPAPPPAQEFAAAAPPQPQFTPAPAPQSQFTPAAPSSSVVPPAGPPPGPPPGMPLTGALLVDRIRAATATNTGGKG